MGGSGVGAEPVDKALREEAATTGDGMFAVTQSAD